MGIIKAVFTSVSGAAADQWKECFMSGGIPADMLMSRAVRFPKAAPLLLLAPELEREFRSALLPILSSLAADGIRPNELPTHTPEICERLATEISDKWFGLRGISVVSIAISKITTSDKPMIANAQRDAMLRDPTTAAATLTFSLADAMRGSAKNKSGNIFVASKNTEWLCECGKSNSGRFCTECGKKKTE